MWEHWIVILAGIWTIISGYIFSGTALLTDLWITGIIVILLGISALMRHRTQQ